MPLESKDRSTILGSLPNLPLGLALERLLETLPIPKILRHYDFYWERERFQNSQNHVVEALYFRKPLFVNNYPVFRSDIVPKGVQAVTINGQVTQSAVNRVRLAKNIFLKKLYKRF